MANILVLGKRVEEQQGLMLVMELAGHRCVDVGTLGDAVGQAYAAKHFPPETKAKADAMNKDLAQPPEGEATDWSGWRPRLEAELRRAFERERRGDQIVSDTGRLSKSGRGQREQDGGECG